MLAERGFGDVFRHEPIAFKRGGDAKRSRADRHVPPSLPVVLGRQIHPPPAWASGKGKASLQIGVLAFSLSGPRQIEP